MILRYLLAWIPMVFIAILNGTLRVYGFQKFMPELQAHQLSTVTLIVLDGIYVLLLNRIWPLESSRQAITIGLLWLLMTILFEFGFGHYMMGHPWSKLFHDYNLAAGRIWSLILIFITIAPYLAYRYFPRSK